MSAAASSSSTKAPVTVVVSGAAGQIGYAIVFRIACGDLLGSNTPINLRLLDIPQCKSIVDGVIMELEDCAFTTLLSVKEYSDANVAFVDADLVFLIGGRPRGPGMTRADLLQANASIFRAQGVALNLHAKKTVKVLVVANPANTNALIAAQNAPNLPKSAFTAMTRLDQNRATALLAKQTSTTVSNWQNVVVWGNHSGTQYPCVHHASFVGADGKSVSARSRVNDDTFLTTSFITLVQQRGTAIIDQMKKSSAASAANAALDHMRDWIVGTAPGQYVSMGVFSDGTSKYGVPANIVFSFPCVCKNGEYTIVQDLTLDEFDQTKLKATAEELLDEAKQATAPPTPAPAAAAAAPAPAK